MASASGLQGNPMASKRRPNFSTRSTSIWRKDGTIWNFVEKVSEASAHDRMAEIGDANPEAVYKIAEYRPKPSRPRELV